MFKLSAVAVFLVLAVVGSYGTDAGKAANAALGQAILDQGNIANSMIPGSTLANR